MMTFLGIALNRVISAANGLTKAPTYSSLLDIQNMRECKASRAGCVSTPHGSNPTLSTPVIGLLGIIQDDRAIVLRKMSGPTDYCVGLGRFVFRVPWEKR